MLVKLVTSRSKNLKSHGFNTMAEKTTVILDKRRQSNSWSAFIDKVVLGPSINSCSLLLGITGDTPHLQQIPPTGTRKRAPLCEGISDTAALPEHWSFHAEGSSGLSHPPAETPAKQVCTSVTNRFHGLAWITFCYWIRRNMNKFEIRWGKLCSPNLILELDFDIL